MIVTLRGIAYHIEMSGQGETVLLLHGFTGSLATWQFLDQALGDRFRLVKIDLMGHGQTACPADPRRYAMDEAVNDLAALIDRLGLEKVHILGYSMGGRLALGFACTCPDRVRSLILESASPGLADEDSRKARRLHDRKLADFIRHSGIRRFVDYWENIPLFESQKQMAAEKREKLRRERLACSENGLAGSLLGMGTGSQPSWWDDLDSLSFPVLLLTGRLDRKFCRIADQMGKRLKKADRQVIGSAGHAVHLEKESVFSQKALKFLIDRTGRK
ncbi:2-succinyl-6-hydroxy-2,4-cyclohexadiene-1-carboxylate synthase [Sporolactobacillus sp. CQH2019]|uniref:2-succinyl-6-hydroxy-2, 4-cyclohexadiene-1-carboxylate synthase n=1 Tax=Sporolactobacillus sp. CQH2019 TaxID=3023512 RepID=UPI002367B98E|nr:2-succinyl-6-hydroxy-2,4-cyclohexadiene-1-carboxylate synthase [Sporolactobacillus sp. CQH2019]MDD9148783.1 2-succinyl-6-hydroxy-2,4-cyclohexadiene-1-carboxylate synthase [Sporolactobacillus sp. CQH2019]